MALGIAPQEQGVAIAVRVESLSGGRDAAVARIEERSRALFGPTAVAAREGMRIELGGLAGRVAAAA